MGNPSDAPEKVLKQFVEALNKGNAQEALGLFDNNAQWSIEDGPDGHMSMSGLDAIAAAIQARIREHIHIEAHDFQTIGDRATCTALVSTDPYRQLGLAPLGETFEIALENERIRTLIATLTAATRSRIRTIRQTS